MTDVMPASGVEQMLIDIADRLSRLVHDRVVGCAPPCQRQVEPGEGDRQADYVGGEYTERLLEQFLPGLVTFEHDDRPQLHERSLPWPRCNPSLDNWHNNCQLTALISGRLQLCMMDSPLKKESNGLLISLIIIRILHSRIFCTFTSSPVMGIKKMIF